MRSAGLKNITAKHLGETLKGHHQITVADIYSNGIAIIVGSHSTHPIHPRIHTPASQLQTGRHADRV
jgi:hypothetical protein